MEIESQATFKEVLQIEADLKAFEASLAQIKTAYQKFMADLGGMAAEVLGVGMFAGIQQELAKNNQLVNEALGVILNMTEQFVEKKDAIEEQAEQRRRQRIKKGAEEEVAQAEAVVAAKNALAGNEFPSRNSGQRLAEDIADEQEGIGNRYVQVWEDALNRRELKSRETWKKEEQDTEICAQREHDTYIAWWEKAVERRIVREREASSRADAAAEQAARNQHDSYVAWWERAIGLREIKQRELDAKEAHRAKVQADKDAANAKRASDEYIAWWERALAERDRAEEGFAQRRRARMLEEMHLAQVAAAEREQAENSVAAKQESTDNKLLDNLKSTTSRLIQYYVIWTAIQGVVDAIAFGIEAPFKLIGTGTKYLDDIQKSADHLTGSMAANVQYSEDFVENLKLAGEASKQSIAALRDIANQTGLSFNHLEDTFRSLVTAGAASHVQTTRDLVQLTQILNIANEQVKGDANLRGLLGDIPRLFHGTLEKGSAFLEVTHLTAQEAKKLVESTKEHRDLLPILTEKLAPYLSAAEQAKLHHANIVNTLEEQERRFAAIIALPVYEKISHILKEILDFVDANKPKLEAIAKLVGDIVVDFEQIGEKIFRNEEAFGFLKNIFLDIVSSTYQMVAQLETGVRLITHLKALWTDSGGLWSDNVKDPKKVKEDFKALEQDFADIGNLDKKLEEYRKRLERIVSAQYAPVGFVGPFPENSNYMYRSQPTVLDQPMIGKGEHPSMDKDPRRRFDARGQFNEEIALIKDYYEQYRDAVKDAEADLLISKRDAAEKHADIAELEIEAIETAGVRLRNALKKYYAGQIAENKATEGDLEDALSKFDASQINAVRRINDQVDQARRSGKGEGNKVEEIEIRNRLALLKEEADQEISITREKYSQRYTTELQALDEKEGIEERAHKAELRAIDTEVAKLAEGTERRAQLLAQRALLEQRYLGVSAQNALQRIAIGQREADALRKHQLELQQSELETQVIRTETIESLKTFKSAYVDIFSIRDREIAAKIREVEIELQLAQARGKTEESTRSMRVELSRLTNERLRNLQAELQAIQSSNTLTSSQRILSRAAVQDALNRRLTQGVSDSSPEALKEFVYEVEQLRLMLRQTTPGIGDALRQFERNLLGISFGELKTQLGGAGSALDKMAVVAEMVSKGIQSVQSAIASGQQGYSSGGTTGAVGGVMQNVGSALPPPWGPIVQGVGATLSVIGGLLVRSTRKIVDALGKEANEIMLKYQNKDLSLIDTIQQLEANRLSAVKQLTDKKGSGNQELEKYLKNLDQSLDSLRRQAKEIITDFERSLEILSLQSEALEQVAQRWDQILKTVQQYVSAGGDASAATKYLSYELERMQKSAQQELDDANQQAIQDAIALNDLLKQRADLAKQFERQKFDLLNEDSLERRKAGAVSRGQRLKELEEEHKKQLENLDAQISLATRKVEMESQVFNISMDISELHRADEELQLKALQLQIDKWKDLKAIVEDIYQMPNGVYTSSRVFNTTVTITINGATSQTTPSLVYDSVRDAIEDSYRNGAPLLP